MIGLGWIVLLKTFLKKGLHAERITLCALKFNSSSQINVTSHKLFSGSDLNEFKEDESDAQSTKAQTRRAPEKMSDRCRTLYELYFVYQHKI